MTATAVTYGNTFQERMEDISEAYVRAVAAQAGYTVERKARDNDGVDVSVECKGKPCAESLLASPKLDIQLKSTYSEDKFKHDANGDIVFTLEVKNYRHLINTQRYIPIILVVLHMPQDENSWIVHTPDHLKVHKCAYWVNLQGLEDTPNTTSINIVIPKTQFFDPQSLRTLMIKISKREEVSL